MRLLLTMYISLHRNCTEGPNNLPPISDTTTGQVYMQECVPCCSQWFSYHYTDVPKESVYISTAYIHSNAGRLGNVTMCKCQFHRKLWSLVIYLHLSQHQSYPSCHNMEPTVRAFGMTWIGQPDVGDVIRHSDRRERWIKTTYKLRTIGG